MRNIVLKRKGALSADHNRLDNILEKLLVCAFGGFSIKNQKLNRPVLKAENKMDLKRKFNFLNKNVVEGKIHPKKVSELYCGEQRPS